LSILGATLPQCNIHRQHPPLAPLSVAMACGFLFAAEVHGSGFVLERECRPESVEKSRAGAGPLWNGTVALHYR
jgi:hypothetical protein